MLLFACRPLEARGRNHLSSPTVGGLNLPPPRVLFVFYYLMTKTFKDVVRKERLVFGGRIVSVKMPCFGLRPCGLFAFRLLKNNRLAVTDKRTLHIAIP